MSEITDSYWVYILLALFLIAFLFVFFWTTPCDNEREKNSSKGRD